MGESRESFRGGGRLSAIRLVVGFSPGSASDALARAIAPALAAEFGRAIEIELRPGRNGADAAAQVAAAPADGGTLFMATLGTHALAPHLDPTLPYDPVHDFAPVGLVASAPLVLACHPSLAVTSARELVDLARAQPRELGYGTSAVGGAPHLAAELFQHMSGIEMCHVRFDRTERLYEELEAGRIALSFNNMMSMLPRCKAGRLRALGVTSAARSAAAPELPALGEHALPGFDVSNWVGLVAPRATPRAAVEALGAALAAALRQDGVREAFVRAGVTRGAAGPEAFEALIAAELARWRPVTARFRDLNV